MPLTWFTRAVHKTPPSRLNCAATFTYILFKMKVLLFITESPSDFVASLYEGKFQFLVRIHLWLEYIQNSVPVPEPPCRAGKQRSGPVQPLHME